jgi:hypothetical protein
VPFRGVFDGNGHSVLHFTYTCQAKRSHIGLFGYVHGEDSKIQNVTIVNTDVDEDTWDCWGIGSLVGELKHGSINNCHAEGGNVRGTDSVGGLVGYSNRSNISGCSASVNILRGVGFYDPDYPHSSIAYMLGGLVGYNKGTIKYCYATGNVLANWDSWCTGGLVGNHHTGTIENSYAVGMVEGDGWAGGLIGLNQAGITQCYSTGDVSGSWRLGGLVGEHDEGTIDNCYSLSGVSGHNEVGGLVGVTTDGGTISNCYSVGSVTGSTYVGGVLGRNYEGTIENSFWDIITSGRGNMCGGEDTGGNGCDDTFGKITVLIQIESTFTDAGWDFVGEATNGTDNIWIINEFQD